MTPPTHLHRHTDTEPLVVDGLSRYYGSGATTHRVLEQISLRVEPGEFVSIVGPSGAGKTTLLRCLSGLLKPTAGVVRYGNTPVSEPIKQIAVVFQDYRGSLMPWMKVRENVAFPLQGLGVKKAERRRRADESLNAVGLPDVGDKYPWQLSGGMQQRVAIARGLAYASPVLLMDEPFGSVDAQARFELEDLVLGLRRDLGISIIVVTHDIDEAVYLGDRVVVLAGKPTTVVDNLAIDLGSNRDQITTRERPEFVHLRSHVLRKIRREEAIAVEDDVAPTATPNDGGVFSMLTNPPESLSAPRRVG
jgi:NitT/TauT family transport system ATP-binding protein